MNVIDTLRHSVRRIAGAWSEFWFAPQDPLSLGVMRVLVGGMMVYTHFVWGIKLAGFFGPDGWQSAEAVRGYFTEDWLVSLWWYVPADHLRLVHILCFVPLVLFMLGLFTPWTSVLALAITISNSNRAPLANYGMDQILSLLGLYLVIGGSGDAFSLDAWRRRKSSHDGSEGAASPQRRMTSQARLGTRLIQVHYCIIYFFAGISKLQGDAWWNGEAVWMAFANQEYQSIDMTWLAHYPWVTQLATHATILWEISFSFLIWNRTLRPFIVLAGIGMHAGIGLCMGMITFGSIMIFGYIAFVPPELMQRVLDVAQRIVTRRSAQRETAPAAVVNETPTIIVRATATDEPETEQTGSTGDDSTPLPDVAATMPDAACPIAICDPAWTHREFTHYLSQRGFRPFVCATPVRLWQHVEQHELCGAVIFIDRLSREDFQLLLGDLTLSPVAELPVLIASQRQRRFEQVEAANLRSVRAMLLPQPYRVLRCQLEAALAETSSSSEAGASLPASNGRKPVTLTQPSTSTVESSR